MEAKELLRLQFKQANQFVEMTMDGLTQDIADRKIPGSTINTIARVYGHMVLDQDLMVGGMVKGGDLVLTKDGWGAKVGVTDPNPRQTDEWAEHKVDVAAFREYARAVYAATDAFLAGAPDADLAKEVDSPLGKQPAIVFLGTIGLSHVNEHWGEIAALKGVQGLKGLPF